MKHRIVMKRSLIAAICCAVVLSVLSGCQLAKEQTDGNAYEDRLIGVFITTEFLSLFDIESYFNNSGFRDGEILMDGRMQAYQNRLYATLVTKTLINEKTGEEIQTEDFVFEGIDGIPFFTPTIPKTSEHEGYGTTLLGDAISNRHISIYVGDNINSTTMEGTIFVSPLKNNPAFYFNPVYQSADYSVYLVSGQGLSMSGDVASGATMNQTLEATTTIMENGITKTDSMSISISISTMFAPEKIIILQMDAENSLISRAEHKTDAMPKTFTPEISTAYIIVETHKQDNTGNAIISRNIYDNDSDSFETFIVREDGICIMYFTQIIR